MVKELMEVVFKELMKTVMKMIQCMKNLKKKKRYRVNERIEWKLRAEKYSTWNGKFNWFEMTEESMNLKNQQKLFNLKHRGRKNNEENEQSLRK